MKTSTWVVIGMVLVAGACGAFAVKARAADNGAGGRPGRGQLLERAKEKLGLTDEQASQIKAVLLGEKDSLKSLVTRLHDARTKLRDAIQASNATETSVRAASAKVAAVEADLAVERLKLFGKISPILTEEQRDKVKEFQSRLDDFVDGAIDRLGERPGFK